MDTSNLYIYIYKYYLYIYIYIYFLAIKSLKITLLCDSNLPESPSNLLRKRVKFASNEAVNPPFTGLERQIRMTSSDMSLRQDIYLVFKRMSWTKPRISWNYMCCFPRMRYIPSKMFSRKENADELSNLRFAHLEKKWYNWFCAVKSMVLTKYCGRLNSVTGTMWLTADSHIERAGISPYSSNPHLEVSQNGGTPNSSTSRWDFPL